MISDTLYDARRQITRYLSHPATKGCYQGTMRVRIENLLKEMASIQNELDFPPEFRPVEVSMRLKKPRA